MSHDDGHTLFLHGLISSGDFSSVFLAGKADDSSVPVVIKCFTRSLVTQNADSLTRVWREQHSLASLAVKPHPFVVRHLFSHVDDTFLFLGMENVGGGDMFTLLQRMGPLPPEFAKVYTAEMVLALGHVHSFDIIYRDLKPENVLVGLDGHAKLADFGSSKLLTGRISATIPPPPEVHSLCGTPEYMAPEILLGHPSCETCDWWSIGCFATELLCGTTPFAHPDHSVQRLVRKIIHEAIELPHHEHIGAKESELLNLLLQRDPINRLGSRESGGHLAVLNSPWFEGMATSMILRKQLPVAWMPILNGTPPADAPLPEVTQELEEMAANHAGGADALIPPAPVLSRFASLPDPFAPFGTRVQLVVNPTPLGSTGEPAEPSQADIESPPAPPSPPGEPTPPAMEEEEEEEEAAISALPSSSLKHAASSSFEASPDGVMDASLDTEGNLRPPPQAAAGWEDNHANNKAGGSSSSSGDANNSFKRTKKPIGGFDALAGKGRQAARTSE